MITVLLSTHIIFSQAILISYGFNRAAENGTYWLESPSTLPTLSSKILKWLEVGALRIKRVKKTFHPEIHFQIYMNCQSLEFLVAF